MERTGHPQAPIHRRWALAGLAATLVVPRSARAAALSVSPTRLQLDPGRPSGAITVRNAGETGTLMQLDTYLWTDGPAVEDMAPTRELVALPAVLQLPARSERMVRIALREPATGDVERSYRVVVGEVPDERQGAGIRFILGFSVPVFVTPQGAAPKPRWKLERGALVLGNTGNAYLQVRSIAVLQGGGIVTTLAQPAYVLAGRTHTWPLDAKLGAGGVTIEADTHLGPLRAELPHPTG